MQLNHLVLVQLVDLELDLAVLRHKDLRWPRVLGTGVVLDAVLAADELRSLAFGVARQVSSARDALVLVSLLELLLLAEADLLRDRVMELSWFERVRGHNLDLAEVLAALCDELLGLY